MNDLFEKRVSAAAVAGWWLLLIAAGFLVLQWMVYLLVMNTRPAWLPCLWGPDISWPDIQNVWFWGIVALKFSVWLLAMLVLWLTLWARQLRERTGGS